MKVSENISVLVVDDEDRIRRLLKMYLEREGYQVDEAENGEEAIENMPIQYFTNPIKKFNVENGKLFGLEMPAGFEAIE